MNRLWDGKLLKAWGLAVGVCACRSLGSIPSRPWNTTFWSAEIWPRLSPTLIAGLIAAAALVTARLVKPERPQRPAALIGAVGAFLLLGLPAALPPFSGFLGQTTSSFREIVAPERLLFMLLLFPPSLAVACWLGAEYWRVLSVDRFWRGPGGAIVKGGLAAGAIGGLLYAAVEVWLRPRALALGPAQPGVMLAHVNVLNYVLLFPLSFVASSFVYTAVLAPWRPSPRLGGFAGSGITLALYGLSLLVSQVAPPPPAWHQAAILMHTGRLVREAVCGAIAGSFAGRWEPEPITTDATE